MGLNYSSRYEASSGLLTMGSSQSDANWYNEMSTASYERWRIHEAKENDLEVIGAKQDTYEAELLVARDALVAALQAARAPKTGLRVACVLQTEDGIYSGSNQEPGRYEAPFPFRHAETAALAKMMQESGSETVDRVIMAGLGQKKMKQVAPCFKCYDMLNGFFNENTELVLFEPGKLDRAVVLNSTEHASAYEKKSPLAITETDPESIKAELRGKSALSEEDIQLVARLRKIGLEHNIALYLTGSASGRGWISQPLKEKTGESPSDLDIVAVTNEPAHKVAELVLPNGVTPVDMLNRGFATREWYPEKKRGLMSHEAFLGSPRHHAHSYKNEHKKTPLEITVAPELASGMLDKRYYDRNFYLQIA
jgi:cytidine deaminase